MFKCSRKWRRRSMPANRNPISEECSGRRIVSPKTSIWPIESRDFLGSCWALLWRVNCQPLHTVDDSWYGSSNAIRRYTPWYAHIHRYCCTEKGYQEARRSNGCDYWRMWAVLGKESMYNLRADLLASDTTGTFLSTAAMLKCRNCTVLFCGWIEEFV